MSKPTHPTAVSLKVLAESKTEGVTKSTTFRVDPKLITFEKGFNLRSRNDELELHIDRIYNAWKAGAFIPPIDVSVVEGEIIARDGHCRTEAALRIRREMPDFTVECRQLRGNDADAVLHMLGTGSGSKPLTPLEQGIGYLRLIKLGLKSTDIANKLGVSRVTIDNGLTLAEAPAEVQQMISQGEVSSTTVRDAIKTGPEAVEALKKAVVEERKNPAPATPKKKGASAKPKKKVTQKKLKGTAAEKKGKKKKADASATPPATPPTGGEPEAAASTTPNDHQGQNKIHDSSGALVATIGPDEVIIVVKKDTAKSAADFLRANAPDGDTVLKEFSSNLETACL